MFFLGCAAVYMYLVDVLFVLSRTAKCNQPSRPLQPLHRNNHIDMLNCIWILNCIWKLQCDSLLFYMFIISFCMVPIYNIVMVSCSCQVVCRTWFIFILFHLNLHEIILSISCWVMSVRSGTVCYRLLCSTLGTSTGMFRGIILVMYTCLNVFCYCSPSCNNNLLYMQWQIFAEYIFVETCLYRFHIDIFIYSFIVADR